MIAGKFRCSSIRSSAEDTNGQTIPQRSELFDNAGNIKRNGPTKKEMAKGLFQASSETDKAFKIHIKKYMAFVNPAW